MKKVFVIISLILLIGCDPNAFKQFYAYCNFDPHGMRKFSLIEYEDCLTVIDSILTTEVKEHFKNQDSAIAVIEISQEIGGLFITRWNLNRYGETKGTTKGGSRLKLPERPLNIPSRFIYDGVEQPEAMIRIIFNCYYKKLNNIPYDWNSEIDKLLAYWKNPETIYYYSRLSDEMNFEEDSMLNAFYYNNMVLNDTVVCLFRRPPRVISKSPDWYYITGIINFKMPEHKAINLIITEIESEFDKKVFMYGSDSLFIGDTLSDYAKDWHDKNLKYFNYHQNEYYR